MKTVYLAIDVHARNCVLGSMNAQGKFPDDVRFPTTEADLIKQVEQGNFFDEELKAQFMTLFKERYIAEP